MSTHLLDQCSYPAGWPHGLAFLVTCVERVLLVAKFAVACSADVLGISSLVSNCFSMLLPTRPRSTLVIGIIYVSNSTEVLSM